VERNRPGWDVVRVAEEREARTADAYRRGYAAEPQEDWIGEAGLRLGAEHLAEQDRAGDE
jgi:hypothetical protein